MQLLIEKIDRTQTITSAKGETLYKVGVFANGKWYSCFQNTWNNAWEEGQTIDVEVTSKLAGNGKTYWNILPPQKGGSASNQDSAILSEILAVLKNIDSTLSNGGS